MAGKGAKRRARLRRQQALRAPRLAGEGNGDGSSGSSSYRTVEFFFHSQLKRIVCYGSEGQPSVITSIYNYCALVFMTFTPSQIPQYTEEDLIDLLNHLLDLTLESLLKDGDYAVEQVKGQMAMAKHYINSTKADPSINLDPYPFSMDSFEHCDFVIFCKALGIRLLHGWVLDHKEHDILCTPDLENTLTYGILQMLFVTCDFSDSDSSAKKGKIMEDLLKEAEKRCTSNGYLSLSGMANGSFALYYWNKKLDVIHKNETYLLILETDEGVLDTLPGVTWRVFEEVDDGNSIYLASDYSLVHNQPNIEKAQQWYSNNHGYSIEPAAGKQSDFEEDQAAVQAGRELSEEDAGMELSEEDAGRELSEEDAVRELSEEDARRELSEVEEAGREAAEEDAGRELSEVEEAGREAAEEAEIEEFSAICNDFECFLHLFKDDGSEMPYFQGVVESLKFTGSPNFYVPYEFIKSHDKALALKIQDNYPRISKGLNQRVDKYISGHKVKKAATLNILHLPGPKSVQAFTEYVAGIALLEEYVFGCVMESPSFPGRKMALGYLHVIVGKFGEGRCFGGRWNISNMWVTDDGTNFTIECEDVELSNEGGSADLERFEENVLARFLTKKGTFPPYFKELMQDFKMLSECRKDPEKWKRFLSLISYPFALKAPLVRSAFICNVYRAAHSVCSGKHVAYPPLQVKGDDWRDHATSHTLLKAVYDYKNFGNGPHTVIYIFTKWGCSYWDLLKFCRHFIEHVLDNSKLVLDTKDILQKIQDIMIVDMIMAVQLGEFIHRLIRFLIMNCDLDGLFSSAWAHFLGSDCVDKPKESNALGPINVQDLVSSFSALESVQDEALLAKAEISSKEGHQTSIMIGNLDLNDFAEMLRKQERHVTCTEKKGVQYLQCGSVTVYKAYPKKWVRGGHPAGFWIVDKDSDPVITVAGPVCDDYYRIFQLVGLWLHI